MRLSRNVIYKASAVAIISVIVSLSICIMVVPLLGGTPDGPGFWMSLWCPLLISWPASAYQFSQTEKVREARDALDLAHAQLDLLHRQLTEAHAELEKKARIDGLTGGLNRDTFLALLETAAAQPGALLLADADHFKRINDSHGHPGGDEVLRAIGRCLHQHLRPLDFWGRVGGEEFAIYLNGANEAEACEIAEAIRRSAQDLEIRFNNRLIKVSLSIGATVFDGGAEPKALYSLADQRLYRAKNSGRNRVVLSDDDAAAAA